MRRLSDLDAEVKLWVRSVAALTVELRWMVKMKEIMMMMVDFGSDGDAFQKYDASYGL